MPELKPLLAVAVAKLDENGILLEANAGFLKLIQIENQDFSPIGTRIAQFFIQPSFASLVKADAEGQIYNSILTIGDYMGQPRSLRTRVWRENTTLHLMAEYDIEEIERLYEILTELNNEYAKAQFELVQLNLKLRQREAEIVALSLTDPLTGIGNRRRMDQELELEIGRAERTGDKLCVLMTDLDYFKNVNDTYGHDVGDKVLNVHVNLLRGHLRPTDVITRFGGEEFIVLMPHTDLDSAFAAAERIRLELAHYQIAPLLQPVTVSIGIAELAKNEQAESLLQRVDKALYQAKNSGRNRVIIAPSLTDNSAI